MIISLDLELTQVWLLAVDKAEIISSSDGTV